MKSDKFLIKMWQFSHKKKTATDLLQQLRHKAAVFRQQLAIIEGNTYFEGASRETNLDFLTVLGQYGRFPLRVQQPGSGTHRPNRSGNGRTQHTHCQRRQRQQRRSQPHWADGASAVLKRLRQLVNDLTRECAYRG